MKEALLNSLMNETKRTKSIFAKVNVEKKPDVITSTSYEKAIGGLAKKIKVSDNRTWKLIGTDKSEMYYVLPELTRIVDKVKMKIRAEEKVPVYKKVTLADGSIKYVKNTLGMRSLMLNVKDK